MAGIPDPSKATLVGKTFDRYEVESLIGRGGNGEVYRAVDTRLRRKVALKILRDDRAESESVARLFREARAAAALSHPNSVAIFDVAEHEGIFYIAMELVQGAPLLAYVGDDRVPLARKVTWMTDVARALSAAHEIGLVHRDVKPSNVMVADGGVVKVLDFGLAKPFGGTQPVSFRTAHGLVVGTPRYMAPELFNGGDGTALSDQYAFGVTAYELFCGKHPGSAIEPMPEPPHKVVTEMARDLSAIVMRMLEREPEKRMHSMEDVVTALVDASTGKPLRISMPHIDSSSSPPVKMPSNGPRTQSSPATRAVSASPPTPATPPMRPKMDSAPATTEPVPHDTSLAPTKPMTNPIQPLAKTAPLGEAFKEASARAMVELEQRKAAHARAHGAVKTLLSLPVTKISPTAPPQQAFGGTQVSPVLPLRPAPLPPVPSAPAKTPLPPPPAPVRAPPAISAGVVTVPRPAPLPGLETDPPTAPKSRLALIFVLVVVFALLLGGVAGALVMTSMGKQLPTQPSASPSTVPSTTTTPAPALTLSVPLDPSAAAPAITVAPPLTATGSGAAAVRPPTSASAAPSGSASAAPPSSTPALTPTLAPTPTPKPSGTPAPTLPVPKPTGTMLPMLRE